VRAEFFVIRNMGLESS